MLSFLSFDNQYNVTAAGATTTAATERLNENKE
jgi:hypothetical protein